MNTAAKRASALGFAFVTTLLVPPDGVLGQGDRQTLAHMYGGILAGVLVVTLPSYVVGRVHIYPALEGAVDRIYSALDGAIKINGGNR